MQWVMPTEARAARIVYGLVGNWFGRVTPEPLLFEKLRERPGMNAARVADVHDVASTFWDLCINHRVDPHAIDATSARFPHS